MIERVKIKSEDGFRVRLLPDSGSGLGVPQHGVVGRVDGQQQVVRLLQPRLQPGELLHRLVAVLEAGHGVSGHDVPDDDVARHVGRGQLQVGTVGPLDLRSSSNMLSFCSENSRTSDVTRQLILLLACFIN